MRTPRTLVAELARGQIGATFNQYRDGDRAPLLRRRLRAYLEERWDAPLLLVGEAPGYRGARVSGIPFTSERQLTGAGPAESTATVVRATLHELGCGPDVLCWNVVPTYPGTPTSNRRPTRTEVDSGVLFLVRLARGRRVVAVGRLSRAPDPHRGRRHVPAGAPCARHRIRPFRLGLRRHPRPGGLQPPLRRQAPRGACADASVARCRRAGARRSRRRDARAPGPEADRRVARNGRRSPGAGGAALADPPPSGRGARAAGRARQLQRHGLGHDAEARE